MYHLLRNISLYSACINSLESAFRPGIQKLIKVMAFTRRPSSESIRNVCTIDYNHQAQGSGRYVYDRACKEDSLRYLKDIYKPLDVNCGELRATERKLVVHMTGRVRFQKLYKFLALHDSHGSTQLVVPEERLDIMKLIRSIPAESHIEIVGTVHLRPQKTVNKKMATGEIEVYIDEILDFFAPKRKIDEMRDGEIPGQVVKKPRGLIPMTSTELFRCVSEDSRKKFQQREYHCNELNESFDGMLVHLSGWIDDKRKNCYFGSLKDGYGSMQLVLKKTAGDVYDTFKQLPLQTLVHIEGTVQLRLKSQRKNTRDAGNVEVVVLSIEIIDGNAPGLENNQNDVTNKLVQNDETKKLDGSSGSVPPAGVNSYCTRSHTCGELRASDITKEVVLYGWLGAQRLKRFGHIRDGHGTTQLIVHPGMESTIGKLLGDTPLESVIRVSGTVCARPPDQVSDNMATGEIEVLTKEFEVLNPAKTDMPFIIRTHTRPKENLRMKYRYIDLRYKDMQYRLRQRSKVLMLMREFLINHRGFVEVETPTLFRKTPGGAQEYIVPTRVEGKFYSLVQSPQQLKQLLMVGSMDRYFQVARCYRDESVRPDRQPEFTQMDIELSFTDKEQIMLLIEDLLRASFPDRITEQTRFPKITYKEAMHWYGTDKPDLSFDKKLVDISELIENYDLLPENTRDLKNFTAKVLIFDSFCDEKKLRDEVYDCEDIQKMKGNNKSKMFIVKCSEQWKHAVKKTLPFLDAEKLKNTIEFPIPSTIVVGIGQDSEILPMMGKLRSAMFIKPKCDLHFAWIVDFPLFLEQDDGTLESAHHPFTQPHKEDVHRLESDPLKVRSLHFDLVLNGYEIGGGSVRIHDPVLQTNILKNILKIPTDSLEHLLEALASGAPPHGGIALGIDRLFSIMFAADTIRDVIAFPKGVDGKDPMCGAPCSISEEEKKLYHLIPRS